MDSFIDILDVQSSPPKGGTGGLLSERQLSLLRQTATFRLDRARRDLNEITSSHDWYLRNGCSEEKYQDFCRMHKQEVDDWEAIVEWIKAACVITK